jgi:hypothetical protein
VDERNSSRRRSSSGRLLRDARLGGARDPAAPAAAASGAAHDPRAVGGSGRDRPRALRRRRRPASLVAVEVDIERAAAFSKTFGPNGGINCFDFRHYAFSCRRDGLDFDLVITNPPFALAMEFVEEALSITRFGGMVAMLLRLPWLASQKRAPWLRRHTPSVYVLPKRPSFYEGAPPTPQPTLFGDDAAEDAKGSGTDATDYAWMVWSKVDENGVERVPTVKILEIEPLVDRRVA